VGATLPTSGIRVGREVLVDGSRVVRDVGDEFACVTMDWWPDNKCDYGVCPWSDSSILNVDLQSRRLRNALNALGSVTLRIGGTQADNITYALGRDKDIACPDFTPKGVNSSNFFGGCLTEDKFREINDFCGEECRLVFGLNLMNGRDRKKVSFKEPCPGSWNHSNAMALLEFAAAEKIEMYGVELGNEIECLSPQEYAADVVTLRTIVNKIYAKDGDGHHHHHHHDHDHHHDDDDHDDALGQPKVIVTDQISWEQDFFNDLIPLIKTSADIITWHNYPLGPGYGNPNLDEHIMNPRYHHHFIETAGNATETVTDLGDGRMGVWMGETGGAYNSGHNETSNAFIYAFWYLQVLGGFAAKGHYGFCRQTLIGGNYELVDKVSHVPNPDYYALRLFNKLMSGKILDANVSEGIAGEVTAWAQCTNVDAYKSSVTIVLLNYGNTTQDVIIAPIQPSPSLGRSSEWSASLYLMTADSLKSRVVKCNDREMRLGPNDEIPECSPAPLKGNQGSVTLAMPKESYAFVVIPAEVLNATACA